MDFRQISILIIVFSILTFSSAKVVQKGFINVGELSKFGLNSTDPLECYEYKFATNYKKILFELTTTPSTDSKYSQRIILSDKPFATCPYRGSEEPNYCTAISNRIYAKTEAMFSKGFPTLYIYIVNQPTVALNLLELGSEVSENSDISIQTTQFSELASSVEGSPMFALTPYHLESGGQYIDSIVPRCASLSLKDCIDPAFCTQDGVLLTGRSDSGANLFSLCTSNSFTDEDFTGIGSADAQYNQNYTVHQCENPIPYNPSLSDTAASILLLGLIMMGFMIFCVCCYNLRLTKTNQAPGDVCSFCPSLFPEPIEDNIHYHESENGDI